MNFNDKLVFKVIRRLCLACAFVLMTIALLSLGCSDSGTDDVDDDGGDDHTPPAAIADLHVIAITTATIELGWTAPGDDGNSGCALEYDLRGALDSITATDFAQAYRIDDVVPPIPAGMSQSCLLDSVDSDQTYYFAIKTRDDAGNWSAISNCISATTPENVVVTFPDVALEQVVRDHINRPSGDIYASDVDTIREFWASEAGVTDLTGLEYFTGMVMLHVAFNDVSDLTPLQNLTSLLSLDILDNDIADLSPIAGLTGLMALTSGSNPFTSIEPLRNLTALETLRLNAGHVADYSPIQGHTSLTLLDVCNNAPIGDITFVSSLTGLQWLSLSNGGLSDISALASLTNLEDVYLVYNSISDISPLVSNSGLGTGDTVHLENNPLSETSLNTYIPALQARGVTVTY